MKWLNKWLGKPDAPRVFLKLSPDNPHQGLDHYSEDASHGFERSICVTGISAAEARLHLVGKVLDWGNLTDAQWKRIESGKPIEIAYDTLKTLFL